MKKYSLFILFLCFSVASLAQRVTRVQLLQSDSFIGMKRNGENTQKVIRPVFQQDNSTLICDSAYFYIEKNSFDAFGHVFINQADTVKIYADLLNYNGNTKTAILTNNVKLIDKGAILTTNNLTYNMATRIGQYVKNGKIVNGENTLTSTNGYYFSNSSDAYFRYNVRVKTPEALILSDTLRYNSLSKIAYFYGPTNIYGKTDTLYTENGQYNTATDQAAFGKKNLYTQNSKSLKGDSLFYDRNAGYGRAVKNILFVDTAQKIELRGNLGVYQTKDESITVTKNAYVVFVTEKDSISKDSIWMAADTLFSKVLMKKELFEIRRAKELQSAADSTLKLDSISDQLSPDNLRDSINNQNTLNSDSTNLTTQIASDSTAVQINTDSLKSNAVTIFNENLPRKDSVAKKELSKKELKRANRRKNRVNVIIAPKKTPPPVVKIPETVQDTVVYKPNEAELQALVLDSLLQDSLKLAASDTTKIRIVSAWRNVKVFKSDMQAKADSAFFSYGDSTLRIYQSPMVWAQGSQISADTMYIQILNNKIDNMDMLKNAIVVNTEQDSVNFNQVAGKYMKGYFENEKLDRVFVDGNAESIYFPKDTTSDQGLLRTLAARMRINFANDSLKEILFIRQPEMTYYPLQQQTEELKTLPNFSWKPKDRPKSKQEIIGTTKVVATKPKTTVAKSSSTKVPKTASPKAPVTENQSSKPAFKSFERNKTEGIIKE